MTIKLELAFFKHRDAHFVLSVFPLTLVARLFLLLLSRYHKLIDILVDCVAAVVARFAAVVARLDAVGACFAAVVTGVVSQPGTFLVGFAALCSFFCFGLRDPNMFCPWRFSRHRSNFCRAFLSRFFSILLSITRVSYCLITPDERREFGARSIMTINKVQILPYNGNKFFVLSVR